jgi:uncharacterized protein YndB with AHSA1/START domain
VRELRTEVTINAPAERVWELLTDFGSFPDWNPFMLRARGEVGVGEKLLVCKGRENLAQIWRMTV